MLGNVVGAREVELHEAQQLSALKELTFQQWEGVVGAASHERGYIMHACLHAQPCLTLCDPWL